MSLPLLDQAINYCLERRRRGVEERCLLEMGILPLAPLIPGCAMFRPVFSSVE